MLGQLAAPNMATPLRDPVATLLGSYVVVVYVDAQNRLFGQIFNTMFYGDRRWESQRGRRSDAPAAVTWSDDVTDQIVVVYVGQSGIPYSRILDINIPNPTFSFGAEKVIGGVLNASPVLVASGYRQLELIGHLSGDRLQHNHFVGATAPFSVDGRSVNPLARLVRLYDNLPGSVTQSDGHFAGTARLRLQATSRTGAGLCEPAQTANHTSSSNNYE